MSDSLSGWWPSISPLLDTVLELDTAAQQNWLAELRVRDPDLADRLVAVLRQYQRLDSGAFLEDNPAAAIRLDAKAGVRIGAYELVELLGEGGMGAVWLAKRADGHFEGQAAVKLLDVSRLRRQADANFVREGNVLAQLQHPNIAHLIDAGQTPERQPYLLLEYVKGKRIDQYCDEQGLELQARVRLFLDVLKAVAHAHSRLVVHCDLKPANILVTDQGLIKLLDFGIAALLKPNGLADRQQENEGAAGLTFGYAAPEQLRGEAVSTATDIYSLGVVLHGLLVKRYQRVERADPTRTSVSTSRRSETRSDHAARTSAPADILAIIDKATAQDPSERYSSVDGFAADLQMFLAQRPVSAYPSSMIYRASKFLSRNRTWVATALTTSLVLIATTVFALLQLIEAQRQRDQAELQSMRAEGFSDIVTSLISQSGTEQRPLTAATLLERATDEAFAKYQNDPRTLTNMLMRIAGRYYDLRDSDREYEVELRAEAAARDSGDPALLLEVLCNTVETELILGLRGKATQRMESAERMMLSMPEVSPQLRADCLRNAAQLAWSQKNKDQAVDQTDAALEILRANNQTKGNRYAGLLAMRASFEYDGLKAHRLLLSLQALHKSFGRQNSVAGHIVDARVARSLLRLGQVGHARLLLTSALPELAEVPMRAPVSVDELAVWSEVLQRFQEPLRAVEALQLPLAIEARSRHKAIEAAYQLALGRERLQMGDLHSAHTHLTAATTLGKEGERYDPWWDLRLVQFEVELALMSRQVDHAEAVLRSAFSDLSNAENANDPFAPHLYLLLARVHMRKGRPADALASARDAVTRFSANTLDAHLSADVGEALLVAAQAHQGIGDSETALLTAQEATAALAQGLAPTHSLTKIANDLIAQLQSR